MIKYKGGKIVVRQATQDLLTKYITEDSKQIKFNYPNSSSCFAYPFKVTLSPGIYFISCLGGKGGGDNGGKGGKAEGIITIKKTKTFYFYIGSKGTTEKCIAFGGGGTGGKLDTYSGGGSTDIRLFNSDDAKGLRSRIIVAAGGGAGNIVHTEIKSGSGGGINGADSDPGRDSSCHAPKTVGATQTAGGVPLAFTGCYTEIGKSGEFFYGGSSTKQSQYTGGGGGGYYGGASTNDGSGSIAGSSGGSSFVSGLDGCNAIGENGIHLNRSIHYSGIKFLRPNTETGVNNDNGLITLELLETLKLCTVNYKRLNYQILFIMLFTYSN